MPHVFRCAVGFAFIDSFEAGGLPCLLHVERVRFAHVAGRRTSATCSAALSATSLSVDQGKDKHNAQTMFGTPFNTSQSRDDGRSKYHVTHITESHSKAARLLLECADHSPLLAGVERKTRLLPHSAHCPLLTAEAKTIRTWRINVSCHGSNLPQNHRTRRQQHRRNHRHQESGAKTNGTRTTRATPRYKPSLGAATRQPADTGAATEERDTGNNARPS